MTEQLNYNGITYRSSTKACFDVICLQLLDACLAPDTSGDGSGCDNMTCIVVLFNSDSSETENSKKRKIQEEKPDSESPDKRVKADDF